MDRTSPTSAALAIHGPGTTRSQHVLLPPMAPGIRRGHGVRLMTCAMAMTACGEAGPPPGPERSAGAAPTPLTSPAPRQPPKVAGDPSTAEWAQAPADGAAAGGAAGAATGEANLSVPAPTGAGCEDSVDDCGLDRVCLEDWPGGFCTGACNEDADCLGAGATCVLPSTEMPGFCLLDCRDDAECFEGYGCDGRHCWPVPQWVR